jgi:hypothetical protein
MGSYDWESLMYEERAAELRRETYLDMRIAHKLTISNIGGPKSSTKSREFKREYNKTLLSLCDGYIDRQQGEIRRRDVWKSEGTV